jgi:phosphatidylethanolamine-binding protein (PEBP) family uncharacterized protein
VEDAGGSPSSGSSSGRPGWCGSGLGRWIGRGPDRPNLGPPRACGSRWWRGSPPVLSLVVALAGCGGGAPNSAGGASIQPTTPSYGTVQSALGTIALSSPAFDPGGAMPVRYTCDGAGVSPPLAWRNVPAGTAELFLLAIDLDGGDTDAIQWAVGGLSPSSHGIPAGRLPRGAVAGRNSAGEARWGGICGARGKLQHVAFLLYALDRGLGLRAGFDPAIVRGGLTDATLARGLTLATYDHR